MTDNVNVHYKDTVFRLLFSDKARLLSLYNALSPNHCDNPDLLKVVTLDDAIYMEVKNDIAFLVGTDIHLWEHQSTTNPNMPLRFLEYIAAEYQKLIETNKKNLYSRTLIKLPQPQFVVFYNGTEDTADHEVMKLSNAFEGEGKPLTLELVADMYNINAGRNNALLDACAALKGYAYFVSRIRENRKTMPFDHAVKKSVDECIRDGILEDFLRSNRSEVVGMSIFEFDREEHDRQQREEGWLGAFYEMVKKKLLSLSIAASEVGQSEEDFAAGMQEYFAKHAHSLVDV